MAPDSPRNPDHLLLVTEAWRDALTRIHSPMKTVRFQVVSDPEPLREKSAPPLASRRLLAGEKADFQLLEMVGKGGMGIVYQAVQTSLGRLVAIKRVRAESLREPGGDLRFLREAELTGRLEHPNIIPVHDLGQDEHGNLFYTMKLVEGRPWSQGMQDLSLEVNLGILARVMDAVAFAHARGVVHRDLKPDNVMLGEFGEVYVVDWGLAAVIPTPGRERENIALLTGGTPSYMAPEIATGEGPLVAPSVDIYLLGAILFEILTGAPPHPGGMASEGFENAAQNIIRPTEVRGELMDLAMRALATEPKDRPSTVQVFQEALREYKSHAESNTLMNIALKAAREAARDGTYLTFQGAVFGFREALRLWPGNRRAKEALTRVLGEFAQEALHRGDLDLAATLLDPSDPSHEAPLSQVKAAKGQGRARQNRLKWLTIGSCVLGAALVLTLSLAIFLVRRQNENILFAHKAIGDQVRLAQRAHYGMGLAQAKSLFEEGQGAKAMEVIHALPFEPRGWELGLLANRIQARTGLSRVVFQAHACPVRALAVSPDGQRVASSGEDRRVLLWESAEGRVIRTFLGREGWTGADALAFSPDGFLLALGDGTVWPLTRKEPLFRLPESKHPYVALAFSPNGRFLASADAGAGIRLWRVPDGVLVAEHKEATDLPKALEFSPDGAALRWGTREGGLHSLRILPTGAFREEVPHPWPNLPAQVVSHAWSKDGVLALGVEDDTIRLGGVDGNAPRTYPSEGGGVLAMAFSADGRWLVGGGQDGMVRVWEAVSGKLSLTFRGHDGKVDRLVIVPDGRVFTGSQDGTVRIWRLPAIEGPREPVTALKYLDRGRILLGRRDGTLLLWDRFKNETLWESHLPGGSIRAMALDARNSRIYCAGEGGRIEVCQAWNGRVSTELPGEKTEMPALAVCGDLLAFPGKGGVVHLCHAAEGGAIQDLPGLEDRVGALEFSSNGRFLAAATVSGGLRVWDVRTWQEVLTVKGEEGRSMPTVLLAFSPESQRVAVGAWNMEVVLYNLTSGVVPRRLEGQTGWGLGAWTRDGKRFLSASQDGKFRIWDPVTGNQLLNLPLPPGSIDTLALSPDGRSVALGGQGLVIWEADSY